MSLNHLYEFHREAEDKGIVPVATPVVGYRRFGLVPAQTAMNIGAGLLRPSSLSSWGPMQTYLHSVGSDYRWSEGVNHAHCTSARQTGQEGSEHPVPSLHCGCGFWAFDDPTLALRHACRSGAYVLGEVEMWGRLVRHEQGWRGEFARLRSARLCYSRSHSRPPASYTKAIADHYPCATILDPVVIDDDASVDAKINPGAVFDPGTKQLPRLLPLPHLLPTYLTSPPLPQLGQREQAYQSALRHQQLQLKLYSPIAMQEFSKSKERKRPARMQKLLRVVLMALAIFSIFQFSAFAFHSRPIPAVLWAVLAGVCLFLRAVLHR